jgi:hypothetical protein
MKRRFLLNTALMLFAGFAFVSSAGQASAGAPKKDAGDPFVRIAQVGLPVIVGSRVVNYVFVNIKIMLSPKGDMVKLQEKEPYFRDLLIKAAHKHDIMLNGRNDTIDEVKLNRVLSPEFTKLAGKGAIKTIVIITQAPKKKQPGYVAHQQSPAE